MGAGAPIKFNLKEMAPIILDCAVQGKSIVETCVALDICRETYYSWINPESDYYKPELSDIINKAETLREAWWAEKGQTGMENRDFNTGMYVFQMINRFRKNWKQRQDNTHQGGVDPIKVERVLFSAQNQIKDKND